MKYEAGWTFGCTLLCDAYCGAANGKFGLRQPDGLTTEAYGGLRKPQPSCNPTHAAAGSYYSTDAVLSCRLIMHASYRAIFSMCMLETYQCLWWGARVCSFLAWSQDDKWRVCLKQSPRPASHRPLVLILQLRVSPSLHFTRSLSIV